MVTPVFSRSEEFQLDGTTVTKADDALGLGQVEACAIWEDDTKQV
jgi:hypothetical protein